MEFSHFHEQREIEAGRPAINPTFGLALIRPIGSQVKSNAPRGISPTHQTDGLPG